MDKLERVLRIRDGFLRIINKYKRLEQRPQDYGTGILHPVEIHTIEMIGLKDELNVTALASEMGVTKGAVSQTLSKLEKKGHIKKVKAADNDKEVHLELTDLGWIAFKGHLDFHSKYDSAAFEDFSAISEIELAFLEKTAVRLEHYLDQYLEDLE